MKPRNEWKFSAAALRVDFRRIVREAEAAVFPMPSVLRITLEGDAKQVTTLIHREAWEGFIKHGRPEDVDTVLEAPRFPVDATLCVPLLEGDRGVLGFVDDLYCPEGDAEWIAIQGDFVGVLSDRIEVKVEVF